MTPCLPTSYSGQKLNRKHFCGHLDGAIEVCPGLRAGISVQLQKSKLCCVVWWTLLTEKLTMGMLLVLGLTSGAWPSWAAAGRPRQRMRSGASRLLLIVGPHRQLGTPGDPGPGNHEYIMWDRGPVSHVISNILGKLNNFY